MQVGGGYRSARAIAAALDAGADRVMVGTAALEPAFLAEAAGRFGERWSWRSTFATAASQSTAGRVGGRDRGELAARAPRPGVRRLLVTSTTRDGSLAGPDLELLAEVVPVGLPVLAAGGIGSLDDLRALRELGCEGAIVGSALLAGRFTLAEAIAALARS